MKRKLLVTMLALLLSAAPLYAGNGDLIVTGNLGVGTTTNTGGIKINGTNDTRITIGWGQPTAWSWANGWQTPGDFSLIQEGVSGERIYIKPGGNVGIGTSSPTKQLEVAGAIQTNSNFIAGGPNSWIFHTPDDGRTHLYIAPGVNGEIWDWPRQTRFDNNGNVIFSGSIWVAGAVYQLSDNSLKKNITDLTDSLNKIKTLRGVSYSWKDEKKEPGRQIGVIAQEVEVEFPDLVREIDNPECPDIRKDCIQPRVKAVDYSKLAVIALQGVKELAVKYEGLEKRLVLLEKALAAQMK